MAADGHTPGRTHLAATVPLKPAKNPSGSVAEPAEFFLLVVGEQAEDVHRDREQVNVAQRDARLRAEGAEDQMPVVSDSASPTR